MVRLAMMLLVVIATEVFHSVASTIVSETIPCCDGRAAIRYHYEHSNKTQCRDSFLIVGVGTAMHAENYDLLVNAIITESPQLVVLTLDAEPYIPVKQGPKPFARAVDLLAKDMDNLLPIDVCSSSPLTIVVGGHSASGAAAFHALRLNYFETTPIAGYLGLDPFLIQNGKKRSRFIASWWQDYVTYPTNNHVLTVPSVYWGLQETTCSVSVEHAAWAGYNQTKPKSRVFYQLRHPSFSHCCFADDGCFCICKCHSTQKHLLHHDVGVSVYHLMRHIYTQRSVLNPNDFQGDDFLLNSSNYILFIDHRHSSEGAPMLKGQHSNTLVVD